ncbi:zinc-ribbon domain-containing protein [Streptomyces axinellae]|uniref:zinc-ribbon domain-containing protein n=1 Tax=Streptomyces axinellae TaxID=552788 RepID=UPI0031D0845D
MIIFGTTSKLVQLAMLNLLCGFCGNPSAHGLRKRVTKFSLFFIPLFPIAPAKHSLQCTFCGAQSEVPKEEAERMLAQAQAPGGQPGAPQGMNGVPQQPGYGGNPYAGQHQPQQPQQQPGNPYQS